MQRNALATLAASMAYIGLARSACSDDSNVKCDYKWAAANGDTCGSLAQDWGLADSAFAALNPCTDCSSTSNALVSGTEYCVEGTPGGSSGSPSPTATTTTTAPASPTTTDPLHPSPTQSGIVSNCNNFYKLEPNTYCQDIVDKYGDVFSLEQFYEWNPAVGNCEYLYPGYYYCVGVPGTPTTGNPGEPDPHTPRQSGTISTCTNWYKAVSGDSCDKIATNYGTFSIAQFEQWNPAVGSDCTSLLAGDWYCVGVPGTPTVKPQPDPHSPHQSGTASNCKSWYKVAKGDTCDSIIKARGIKAANFYKWNPAVGTDCKALWLGYWVCVGV